MKEIKPTSARAIATYIAVKEGMKSSVTIGNIREIVGIVSDLLVSEWSASVVSALVRNGSQRKNKKQKPAV